MYHASDMVIGLKRVLLVGVWRKQSAMADVLSCGSGTSRRACASMGQLCMYGAQCCIAQLQAKHQCCFCCMLAVLALGTALREYCC
jgi:hypothetical protein